MSKRILAMLLSLLMVLSVCFTTACKDETDANSSADSSAEEQKELTAKELFVEALENLTEGMESPSLEIPENIDLSDLSDLSDMKAAAKLDINKLNIMGIDYTKGSPISLNIEASADVDGLAAQLNASVNYADEAPSISGILNADGLYITDLLGVYDGNLFLPIAFEEYLEDFKAEFTESEVDLDTVNDAFDAIDDIVAVIKNSIDSNLPDESYTKETKDTVVNDVEFKNATVVTLTVTKENAEKIAKDIIEGIFAIDFIANNLGEEAETTKQEALDEIDLSELESVKINAILNEDSDILGADFTAYAVNDVDFAIRIASANGGYSIKAGMIDDNGAFIAEDTIVYADTTYDKDTKAMKLVVGIIEGEQNTEFLKIEGTADENKCEGVLTVTVEEEQTISLNFAVETTEDSVIISIKDISASGMTIPANLTITISGDENKVAIKVDAKLNIEGMAECDIVLDTALEINDVEITAPSDAVNFEEIPDEDAMMWLGSLQTKYPKLAALVTDLIGSLMSNEDEYTEEDFYYEDDYVYDEDFVYGEDFYYDEDYTLDENFFAEEDLIDYAA